MALGLRIGEAARSLGVSPDTLKRLEERGVVAPRRDWIGQRRYQPRDMQILHEILSPHKRVPQRPQVGRRLRLVRR